MRIVYLFFLVFPLVSFSQTEKCKIASYSKILTRKEVNLKKNDQTVKKRIKQFENSTKQSSYKLIFNNNESLFFLERQLKNDVQKNRLPQIGGGSGVFYKKGNTRLHQINVAGDLLLVSSQKDKYNWKLFNESKIIYGKKCFKAEGNYKEKTKAFGLKKISITAWYCPELPYSFGPNGFDELPGLIFELTNGGISFVLTELKEISDCSDLKIPKKGKKMTDEEGLKYLDQLFENLHD